MNDEVDRLIRQIHCDKCECHRASPLIGICCAELRDKVRTIIRKTIGGSDAK